MAQNDIDDFGEKIGGARKDLRGNVRRSDVVAMTPDERLELIRKDVVWPTPNYQKLVSEDGYTKHAAAAIKMLRDSIPARPMFRPSATDEQKQRGSELYVDVVNALKSVAETGKTAHQLSGALLASEAAREKLAHIEVEAGRHTPSIKITASDEFNEFSRLACAGDFKAPRKILNSVGDLACERLDRKTAHLLRRNTKWPETVSQSEAWLKKEGIDVRPSPSGWALSFRGSMNYGDYGREKLAANGYASMHGQTYPDEDTARQSLMRIADERCIQKRKTLRAKREELEAKALGKTEDISPELLARAGPDHRNGADVGGEDYLSTFGLRGGEFGIWVNQKERQEVLNRGFDAFHDLAGAFELPPSAISLGGDLAIAFGARGRGGWAAAHYELGRRVINLTKPSGEGCLAHEFGHALDHYLGKRAREMSLVASTKRPDWGDMLSNLNLRKPLPEKELPPEEVILREFAGLATRLGTHDTPLTKAELLAPAIEIRDKNVGVFTATVAQTTRWAGRQSPELLTKVQQMSADMKAKHDVPEPDLIGITNGMINGFNSIPEMKGSPGVIHLESIHSVVVKSIQKVQNLEALPNDWEGERRSRPTAFQKACTRLDEDRSSPYYSLPHEMFARSFESMVADRMREAGRRNYFLVGEASGAAFPQGDERDAFSKELGGLIERLPSVFPAIAAVVKPTAGPENVGRAEGGIVPTFGDHSGPDDPDEPDAPTVGVAPGDIPGGLQKDAPRRQVQVQLDLF